MPAAKTPAALGYRMPAEWEPHAATWIAWPHNRDDWPGKFTPIPWLYVEIVRHLHVSERIRILTRDRERPARMLARAGVDLAQIDFLPYDTDRVWTRDYGPMFVRRGRELAINNWRFNGWAKYSNWKRDDRIAARVARARKLPRFEPGLVLEGGAIDVNGEGDLLTTEECLLSPVQARNPGRSRAEVEQALRDYLGARRVLWLGRGIAGDDTHGHIDDIARFVGLSTVVAAVEPDRGDPNYEPLAENLKRLREVAGLRVVRMPMPAPVLFDGRRLPASYLNFYIANKVVLMPTFHDPNDRVALRVLAELFPDRAVIGIHSVDLVWGLGTLHCLTQQEPAV
jgi:agmatine deiminase